MCEFVTAALASMFTGGAAAAGTATAAGATAAAATAGTAGAAATGFTFGQALQMVGTAVSIGGALAQGQAAADAANTNARLAEERRGIEAQLTAVEDSRTRERFRIALRQQAAEIAGRGVSLASPTALRLGRSAAAELAFASQEVRSRGAATDAELSATSRAYRASAKQSILKGTLSAASRMITTAPDLWPELADRRMLA